MEVSQRRRGVQEEEEEEEEEEEFAHLMHHLAEEIYPDAEKICLVYATTFFHPLTSGFLRDLLSGDRSALSPQDRVLLHTPVHGLWLNMAEIEISVLW